MPRSRPAAMLRAAALGLVLTGAVCADARTAFAFEDLPRPLPEHRPHRAAWTCALLGAGLVAASFPLADMADRRYATYLVETNPAAIESRWDATVRADRMANGALLAGEGLIVTAVWYGVLRRPAPQVGRVSLRLEPARCVVCCRF